MLASSETPTHPLLVRYLMMFCHAVTNNTALEFSNTLSGMENNYTKVSAELEEMRSKIDKIENQ